MSWPTAIFGSVLVICIATVLCSMINAVSRPEPRRDHKVD